MVYKTQFSEISYMEKEDELINFFTKLFSEYIKESKETIEDQKFEQISQFCCSKNPMGLRESLNSTF